MKRSRERIVKGPVEKVVNRRAAYSVIEKIDRAFARIARELNPRRADTS